MADFARDLPLSQRPREDESSVTGDWRPMVGECLGIVAEMLAVLTVEEWRQPSLRDGWTIREVAGHLSWRLGRTFRERTADRIRTIVYDRVSPFQVDDHLAGRAAPSSPAELVDLLRSIADDRLALHGHRSVRELTEVVVHGYDIFHALGRPVPFPPVATGAVALARTLTAPTPIKAIVRGRTLRATDAGWSIGHGTELAAPADALVLFLFGRSTVVPGEPA